MRPVTQIEQFFPHKVLCHNDQFHVEKQSVLKYHSLKKLYQDNKVVKRFVTKLFTINIINYT